MAPRDYARLHWDWYRDPVLRAVAEQEPVALRVWPVLIAMAKEASHAVDNPSGVIETTWSTIASHCFTDADTVARVMGLLVDGEMVEIDAGRLSVQRVSLARFRDWQVPRSGSGERESKRRERGSSREKGVERDADVSHAPPSSTETETERDSPSLRSSSAGTDVALVEPKPAKKAPKPIDPVVVACFNWYCELWGKSGAFAIELNRKRELAIEKALRQHGKEKVVAAIRGHHLNPWRHEQLSRNDIAKLLTPENIELGVEWAAKAAGVPQPGAVLQQNAFDGMGYE